MRVYAYPYAIVAQLSPAQLNTKVQFRVVSIVDSFAPCVRIMGDVCLCACAITLLLLFTREEEEEEDEGGGGEGEG